MGKMSSADDTINLKEIYFALKERLLMILVAGLLFGCISCAYTKFLVAPVYSSTATMLVLTKETTLASMADLQLGTQLTKDYSVLINSRPVLQEVIDNMGLNMSYKTLRNSISVSNPDDTRILLLTVNNTDAALAKEIVDELSAVSSEYIGDKMEVVPPKIIEDGEIPTSKTSPDMKKSAVMGVLAGMCLVAGLVTVLTILDDTIKSEDDISKYLKLSTLSAVPDRKDYINSKNGKRRQGPDREERRAVHRENVRNQEGRHER